MEAGVMGGKAVIVFDDDQCMVNTSQRNIQEQNQVQNCILLCTHFRKSVVKNVVLTHNHHDRGYSNFQNISSKMCIEIFWGEIRQSLLKN